MKMRHWPFYCTVIWLCLSGMVGDVAAQTVPDSPGTGGSADSPSAKSGKEPSTVRSGKGETSNGFQDLIQLKNAQGDSFLLSKPIWDEVLAALAIRSGQLAADPPPWSVASISLDGTSDGDTVTLKAVLKILVLVDGRWVKVPLKLNEGVLQDQSYTGSGEATSAGIDPIQGYQWWFKGKGLHVLNLTLNIPLRKEQPSRRLQLSLQNTVVSDLKLKIPMPRITAKVAEQSRSRLVVSPAADGTTTVEMLGLGTELDLRWQPQPELGSVATVLQAQTSISAVVDGRTVSLDVGQKVVALQGSFNQLQVRLPLGSELLQIKGEHYKEHVIDPKDPTSILVTLKETASDTSTPVELKWKIRIESPLQDQLLLQGFEIAKAKLQTGYVAVKVIGDYRLEADDDGSRFVHRANLSSLEEAQPSFSSLDDVSSAFGFTRQPFQLAIHLRPEKPLVTIKPRLFLSFSNDRMELFGEYDLQFYRGRIEDVKFAWMGWKEEGWKVDPITVGNVVQSTALDDPAGIAVKLITPATTAGPRVADKPGTNGKGFTLLLHATRPLLPGQVNPDFSLPTLPDANVQPAEFVLVLADNLDADLRPSAETAPRLQSAPVMDSIVVPKSLSNLTRRRFFRLDAPRPRFSVVATLQKQRISVSTDTEFQLEGTELKVSQRLSYDVAYERLSQVLLLVPDAWLDRAQFFVTADGKATKPIFTGASENNRKQVLLVLEGPSIGKFDVLVTTALPLVIPPGQVSKALDVALIQTSDSEFASTRVRIQKPKRQRLTVASEGWTPQSPQGGSSVWVATAKQSSLTLQCDQSDTSWRQGVAVPRRLVSAVFSPRGDVYCQVQYRLAGYVPVLRLTFPAGATKKIARWMPVVSPTLAADSSTQATPAAPGDGTTPLSVSNSTAPVVNGQAGVNPAPGLGTKATAVYQELPLTEMPSVPGQVEITLPEIVADAEHLVTFTYQLPQQSPLGSGAFRQLEVPDLVTDGTPTETFWQIQLPENQLLWTLPPGLIPEFDWQIHLWWWSRTPRQSVLALRRWVGESIDPRQAANLSVSGSRYVFSSLDSSTTMSFWTLSSPLIVLIGASLALVFGFTLVNVPSSRHVLTFLALGFVTTLAALWYAEPVLVLLQPACLGLVLAVLATLAQRWRSKSRGIEPVVTLGTPSDILAAASSHHEPGYPVPASHPELSETHAPAIGLPDSGAAR